MPNDYVSSQLSSRLFFNGNVDVEWLQRHLPQEFVTSLRSSFGFSTNFSWTVDVTDSHLMARRNDVTFVHDLEKDHMLLVNNRDKTYHVCQPSRRTNAAQKDIWTTQQGDRQGDRQRLLLTAPSIQLDVWITDSLPIPTHIRRALWEHLLPGVPETLSQGGLLVEVLAISPKQPNQALAHLKLANFQTDIQTQPFSTTPPHGFRPVNAPSGAQVQQQAPQYHNPQFDRLHAELKRQTRQMLNRHTIRESGQSFAWIMHQPVLDRIRSLFNTFIRGYDRFQGVGDGSISLVFDLWPSLKRRLNDADFEGVEGVASGTAFTEKLEEMAMLVTLLNGELPVRDSVQTGGMTEADDDALNVKIEEAKRAAMIAAMSEDLIDLNPDQRFNVLLAFFVLSRDPRRAQIREAQLRFLMGPRIIPLDPFGNPITELRFRVPDDDDTALVGFSARDFNLVLNIEHQEIFTHFDFREGFGRLRLHIPHVRLNLNWETYAVSSPLAIVMGIFTLGAYMQWIINTGSWNFGAHPVLVFDIFPQAEGTAGSRVIRLRPVINTSDPGTSTIVDWRADPLISANPLTAELLGLWSQIAAGSFNLIDYITTDLLRKIASQFESMLNAPAFRWPEVWQAKEGPGTFGLAALFRSGSGTWEGEFLNSGFLLPRAAAVSVDPSHADLLGVAVSRRYLAAWLQQMLRHRLSEIPSTQSLSIHELEAAFGVWLPPPESIEAEGAGGETEETLELLRRAESLRCPPPPAPPPPISEHIAVLILSTPTVHLPPPGVTDHVAEFNMHFQMGVYTVRTWDVPVISAEGPDCLPDEEIDLGLFLGLRSVADWWN